MPKNIKLTFEQAFNRYLEADFKLLDSFYHNNWFPHNALCKCGNNYIPSVEELKKEFAQQGCKFLDDFYVNSHYKHNYMCSCGNKAQININNWRNGKRCKICGNTLVYDRALPANVYLLTREEQIKIGINNRKSWRLVNHKRNGWTVVDKIGPIKGEFARSIEKTILDCLDDKGIPRGKKIFKEPFDGYSEVWLAKDFYVESLSDLWDKL